MATDPTPRILKGSLPEVVGLCPGAHKDEFYVPHGGVCPSCERDMQEYVPVARAEAAERRVAELEAALHRAVRFLDPPGGAYWPMVSRDAAVRDIRAALTAENVAMNDSDLKTIAFGYYVLGFFASFEGVNGELPPPDVREWLREKFDQEWRDVGESGRKALQLLKDAKDADE